MAIIFLWLAARCLYLQEWNRWYNKHLNERFEVLVIDVLVFVIATYQVHQIRGTQLLCEQVRHNLQYDYHKSQYCSQ